MSQTARLDRGLRGWVASASFIVLSAYYFYEMRLLPQSVNFSENFDAIVNAKQFPEVPKLSIRHDLTGIEGLDHGLGYLVTAFLPGAVGFKRVYQIQQAYFLISFFSLISIYCVEAGRRGMKYGWIYFTSLWGVLYQTVGGACIVPLYCLASMRDNSNLQRINASDRRLNLNSARALIPALLFGYLLPTIALYTPFSDPDLHYHQGLIALWQPVPLFVNLLLVFLRETFELTARTSNTKTSEASQKDMSYVRGLFLICMTTTAIAHFAMLYSCAIQPDGFWDTLLEVLVPHISKLQGSASAVLHYIFQVDFIGIFGSSLLWILMIVWDMRTLRQTRMSITFFTIASLLGSVMVGPASVIAFIWYWREDKIRIGGRAKAT